MMRSQLVVGGAIVWLLMFAAASGVEAQPSVVEPRYFLSVDGGGQSGSQQLQDLGEIGILFGEPMLMDTNYNIDRSGGLFRANGTIRLRGNLGVGVGFTRGTSTGEAGVTVQAPHPIFLNRPRVVSQSLTALGHRESRNGRVLPPTRGRSVSPGTTDTAARKESSPFLVGTLRGS